MNDRMYFLLMRPPSQPATYVPTMLKSPISASAVTATCGGMPAVGQIRGQVHADEHDLEAADEEAQRQEHVAAMPERLARSPARCRLLERVRLRVAPLDHRRRQRHDEQRHAREREQRAVPAEVRRASIA